MPLTPTIGIFQATFNCETLDELIWLEMDRVPYASAFGSDHSAAADDDCDELVVDAVVVEPAAVVEALVVLLVAEEDVLVAVPAEGVDELLLLPPHAAIAAHATTVASDAANRLDTIRLITLSSIHL